MLGQFKEAHDLFAAHLDPALKKIWTSETALAVEPQNGMSLTRGRGFWFPGRNVIAARRSRMADNFDQTDDFGSIIRYSHGFSMSAVTFLSSLFQKRINASCTISRAISKLPVTPDV